MERFGLRKWLMVAIKAPIYALMSALYLIGISIAFVLCIPINVIAGIAMAIWQAIYRYREGEDVISTEKIRDDILTKEHTDETSVLVMTPIVKLGKWIYGIKN